MNGLWLCTLKTSRRWGKHCQCTRCESSDVVSELDLAGFFKQAGPLSVLNIVVVLALFVAYEVRDSSQVIIEHFNPVKSVIGGLVAKMNK